MSFNDGNITYTEGYVIRLHNKRDINITKYVRHKTESLTTGGSWLCIQWQSAYVSYRSPYPYVVERRLEHDQIVGLCFLMSIRSSCRRHHHYASICQRYVIQEFLMYQTLKLMSSSRVLWPRLMQAYACVHYDWSSNNKRAKKYGIRGRKQT